MRFLKPFYRIWNRDTVERLEARILELSPSGRKSWYYYIYFGYGVSVRPDLKNDPHSGESNWRNFLSKHLPDLRGKRILDIGCNAGLYDQRMLEAGAVEVVGIDRDVQQAQFVRDWFSDRTGSDYSQIQFVAADATKLDFTSLGHFDLACIFRVAYHFGEGVNHVMSQLEQTVDTIVMQGNTPRLHNPKYAGRSYQHLAGVEGMQDLLQSYNFKHIQVIAPKGHLNPLVIGSKAK